MRRVVRRAARRWGGPALLAALCVCALWSARTLMLLRRDVLLPRGAHAIRGSSTHAAATAAPVAIDYAEGARFCFDAKVPRAPAAVCAADGSWITERAAANVVRSVFGLAPLRAEAESAARGTTTTSASRSSGGGGFSAKCLRRKLCDRRPILTALEDKWQARLFVTRVLGATALPRLLAAATAVENIDFSLLPHKAGYVIKVNHWAGGDGVLPMRGGVDLKSGAAFGVQRIKTAMRGLLESRGFSTKHLYRRGREHRFEWAVARICPRVVYVEELVVASAPRRESATDHGPGGTTRAPRATDRAMMEQRLSVPLDFKLLCFGGRVEIIEVLTNRSALDGEMRQLWYDRNWNEFKENTTMVRMTQPLVVARRHLDQMVAWADALSAKVSASRLPLWNIACESSHLLTQDFDSLP